MRLNKFFYYQTKETQIKKKKTVRQKLSFILKVCVLQLNVAVASAPTYELLKSSREQRTQF